MAGSFTPTGSYTNLSRLELEALRRSDYAEAGRTVTIGDSGLSPESVVGRGSLHNERFLTGPSVLLDDVYGITPPTSPGKTLGTLTQAAVGLIASEAVQWYGAGIALDSTGHASAGATWEDVGNLGAMNTGDILLVKDITDTAGGVKNIWAVATIDVVTANTVTLTHIVAPSSGDPTQLEVDGHEYAYVVVRQQAVRLFAVPGSGPTGREQTFFAVGSASTQQDAPRPNLTTIDTDRVTSLVPPEYSRSTLIDRADGVFDGVYPRASLDTLGYRIVLYPAKDTGGGGRAPDYTKPIAQAYPVIDPAIPATDQRLTIDYKAGTIRCSCAPVPGSDLNPNSVVNPTSGRLDLYAVFWAVDQSLTVGTSRGLWASRSTSVTQYTPGRVYFDTAQSLWRMGSSAQTNAGYVRALGTAEDPDRTTELGALVSAGTIPRRYFAYRPSAVNKPGGLNPTGRWRMLNQDTLFPGIGLDLPFTTEQEISDRTAITVGDISAPPHAQADVAPTTAFQGTGMVGARDSGAALLAALMQAISGGHSTVQLKKGRYYTNAPITIPPGVTLAGVGPGTVVESRTKLLYSSPLSPSLSPLTTPVFKMGPNTRYGTYDPSYTGTPDTGTFDPCKFVHTASIGIEGMDIVWNPVRRVWGVCWANPTTKKLQFNEVAADGQTLTFPGLGVDVKNSASVFFTQASTNSSNHTPGHYPRLAYHAYTDTYVVTWVEEYVYLGTTGPRVAVQAFNVHPFPQSQLTYTDPVTWTTLPATLTTIWTSGTPQYITDVGSGAPYTDHPSVAVDTSNAALGFNIHLTCWGYGVGLVTSCIFRGLLAAQLVTTLFPTTVVATAHTVISSTDTADDGDGNILRAWSRREHPLILSSTGELRLSGINSYSYVYDTAHPDWVTEGLIKVGTRYIPLGPTSLVDRGHPNWMPVYSVTGATHNNNTFTDASADFVASGIQANDYLVDYADASILRILSVDNATTLTVSDVIPGVAGGKTYWILKPIGFQSLEMLTHVGGALITDLYAPSTLTSLGSGYVYEVGGSTAKVRPEDRANKYLPTTPYIKWNTPFATGTATGSDLILTDSGPPGAVDFTLASLNIRVGDTLMVGTLGVGLSVPTFVGTIASWTANTLSIRAAGATSLSIPATLGSHYCICSGNISYAMVPQSYIEGCLYNPTYGYSSTRSIAGAPPSATQYTVATQEPDFVRISRGDGDWIAVYQSFETTGFFSQDSNVNWDGGGTYSTWKDAGASKHLRVLDSTAVYRIHLSTCAAILNDAGFIYMPEAEGALLTPDVPTFVERASRAFEVSNRSLGARDPITLRTGYHDLGSTTGQLTRSPHPFSMEVSPLCFTHRWTTTKSMSLIPDVTWSGSDWTVVSPSKKHLHSYVGNYIVDGAGNVSLGDLSFMFGTDAANPIDGTFLRQTVSIGDRIYFPAGNFFGTIAAVHNEHIVTLVENDGALLGAGSNTTTPLTEWVLIRPHLTGNLPLGAGLKNPGYRVSSDGKVLVSSQYNTFADEPLDNSELVTVAPVYPRTQLMRRIYDDAYYNTQLKYDGPNLPGGLRYDMLEPESRYVSDVGFRGVAVGEPKGCNELVLDEPPMVALAWGENLYGFVEHLIAGPAVNEVRVYRQSFGPYNAGLQDLRVIGRQTPIHTDADTSYELKFLSRRMVGTRHGPPTGAMGFFATDGYRNVFGKAVCSASYHALTPQVIGQEWMQPSFIYTNCLGGNPLEVYGPAAIIPNGGLQNDVAWMNSVGAATSISNANALAAAPKVIWDGKQFVAAWSEGGRVDQEQVICLAFLPGGEDQRTLTFDQTDPQDTLRTKVAAIRSVDNRQKNDAVTTSSVVALDIAYSGTSYAVLWAAGLNYQGWYNGGAHSTFTSMIGVTLFDETGSSGGFGPGASLDSPAVIINTLTLTGGWGVFGASGATHIKSPIPAVGDIVLLVTDGPADGSGLGRYTVMAVPAEPDVNAQKVQLSPTPPDGTYDAVLYRTSKGNGGLTHILDVQPSKGDTLSHPSITWNGHSFLAMWRQGPKGFNTVQSLAYVHVPPHGFVDPVHIKWFGSGNEGRDFVTGVHRSCIGTLPPVAAGLPGNLYFPQQINPHSGTNEGHLDGHPPYPMRGDTVCVTSVVGNLVFKTSSIMTASVVPGSTTVTDASGFGAVVIGDILLIVSGVSAEYLGYYTVVSIPLGTTLVLDRAVVGTGIDDITYQLAHGSNTTLSAIDNGWYLAEFVNYNSTAPYVQLQGKSSWQDTLTYINVRVYGMLLSGGTNDSRSLQTGMPFLSGSNMAPKILAYEQTGQTGLSVPQGQSIRYLARFYGTAYNPEADEYAALFGTAAGTLVSMIIRGSTMEPTHETVLYTASGGLTCRAADIAWNGRHYMVTYSIEAAAGTPPTSTAWYTTLSPNLVVQETRSIAGISALAGPGIGLAPGAPCGALYASSAIYPRIRNMQVRWNPRLNRWVVGTSVLWALEWGTAATDDVMAAGWNLAASTPSSVTGNVLTLDVGTDFGLLQVGMRLVFRNPGGGTPFIQSVFGILALDIVNLTITLDTSFPQDLNGTTVTPILGLGVGCLWVYPREDTWCFTIGYDQPIVQIEDADGSFVEGVTFDGMMDVEEKYLRMACPILQSGGSLVGWPAWSGTALTQSFFTRRPYNHALLTPAQKVNLSTFTNVRSNTKVRIGYGAGLQQGLDRYRRNL